MKATVLVESDYLRNTHQKPCALQTFFGLSVALKSRDRPTWKRYIVHVTRVRCHQSNLGVHSFTQPHDTVVTHGRCDQRPF